MGVWESIQKTSGGKSGSTAISCVSRVRQSRCKEDASDGDSNGLDE